VSFSLSFRCCVVFIVEILAKSCVNLFSGACVSVVNEIPFLSSVSDN
jgi:hypothetical protein